jgi:hypothetical protein
MTKRHLLTATPGPWLVVRKDAEHAIVSNTADRTWGQVDHYVGRVRTNNAPLIIAAHDLLTVAVEIRALAFYAGTDERGAIKITITPELYAELERVIAATKRGDDENILG